MDIENKIDCQLIDIASQYVPLKSQYDFAELSRNAIDIYDLIFNPMYEKITKPIREKNKASLMDILSACLNNADLKMDKTKTLQYRNKSLKFKMKQW